MGVDFYPCRRCNETFADCGPNTLCSEDLGGCGAWYCSDDCAELESPGYDDPIAWEDLEGMSEEERQKVVTTCVDCRGQLTNDDNLFTYLIQRLGVTREEVVRAYLTKETGPFPTKAVS